MDLKQVIIVRNDLKMPKGKLAAQAAHASVESMMDAKQDAVEHWRASGSKKVVLKVDSLDELKKYYALAKRKFPCAMIKDAGNTFFSKPTITCIGIGPAREEEIDSITKDLSLL